MRVIYQAVLWVMLLPFLWITGRKELKHHGGISRLMEFVGYYNAPSESGELLWIHAASVGEVVAATPFIDSLRDLSPSVRILITTTTPTGADRVREIYGEEVDHAYLPYDLPRAVSRFFSHFHPVAGIIMETEIWPNLFHHCGKHNIPLVMANVRLSQRSLEGYQRWIPKLAKKALQNVTWAAAQGGGDAKRLITLGAEPDRVEAIGSIKFDLTLPEDIEHQGLELRDQLGNSRPIWIAASTREGEESYILEAHQSILQQIPDTLLILVPRHPERFNRVAGEAKAAGFQVVRRSRGDDCVPAAQIYLGDTMGEMLLLYAAADVAYVGGSLVPTGSHNMLEPAALGKPVLFGPHRFNFSEISQLLIDQGAAEEVNSAVELAESVIMLLQTDERRRQMGWQGLRVVEQNRGALDHLLAGIQMCIPKSPSS